MLVSEIIKKHPPFLGKFYSEKCQDIVKMKKPPTHRVHWSWVEEEHWAGLWCVPYGLEFGLCSGHVYLVSYQVDAQRADSMRGNKLSQRACLNWLIRKCWNLSEEIHEIYDHYFYNPMQTFQLFNLSFLTSLIFELHVCIYVCICLLCIVFDRKIYSEAEIQRQKVFPRRLQWPELSLSKALNQEPFPGLLRGQGPKDLGHSP